jgi:ribosomal protein S18 acetylase RimI-like enzyme
MYKIEMIVKDDKELVTLLCKDIWEGDDYLPKYFDDWIVDSGEFVKVIHEEKIVGLGKLTMVSDSDLWIEGLRKDPHFEGKGVGSFIIQYFLDKYSNDKCINSIRLSTYKFNPEAISLFEKFKFKKILTRSYKFLNIDPNESYNLDHNIRIEKDLNQVLNFVNNSQYVESLEGFINKNWVVYPKSDDLIKWFVDQGLVASYTLNGRVVGLVALYHTKDSSSISFIDGESKYLSELLKFVKSEMKRSNIAYLSAFQTIDENVKAFITESGF